MQKDIFEKTLSEDELMVYNYRFAKRPTARRAETLGLSLSQARSLYDSAFKKMELATRFMDGLSTHARTAFTNFGITSREEARLLYQTGAFYFGSKNQIRNCGEKTCREIADWLGSPVTERRKSIRIYSDKCPHCGKSVISQ